MNKFNLLVQDYFVSSRTPEFTSFFSFITSIFDLSSTFFIIVVLISLLIYRLKDKKYLYFFFSNIFITMFTVYFLKLFFDTKRPTDSIINAFGASFPSYHATIATVFILAIIFIFKSLLQGFNLKILHILGFLMIILVSISRIYLGVHWVSDVLFGVMLGAVIHHTSIHIFKKYQ